MRRLREGRRGVNRVRGVSRGVGRYRPAATRGGTFVLRLRQREASMPLPTLPTCALLDFGNGLVARADGSLPMPVAALPGPTLLPRRAAAPRLGDYRSEWWSHCRE